jgi:hypothetical protein
MSWSDYLWLVLSDLFRETSVFFSARFINLSPKLFHWFSLVPYQCLSKGHAAYVPVIAEALAQVRLLLILKK